VTISALQEFLQVVSSALSAQHHHRSEWSPVKSCGCSLSPIQRGLWWLITTHSQMIQYQHKMEISISHRQVISNYEEQNWQNRRDIHLNFTSSTSPLIPPPPNTSWKRCFSLTVLVQLSHDVSLLRTFHLCSPLLCIWTTHCNPEEPETYQQGDSNGLKVTE